MRFTKRKISRLLSSKMSLVDRFFLVTSQVVLVSYFAFMMVAYASHQPSIRINSISTQGVISVDEEAIKKIAEAPINEKILGFIRKDNHFFYPKNEVTEYIKAYSPRIAYAEIADDVADNFTVRIVEYMPVFLVCKKNVLSDPLFVDTDGVIEDSGENIHLDNSSCMFADENGYLFGEAPEYSGFPFTQIFVDEKSHAQVGLKQTLLSEEEFITYKKFLDALAQLGIETHALVLEENNDVRLFTNLPYQLLWSSSKDIEKTTANLGSVLSAFRDNPRLVGTTTLIDLRFGNKIFYK